MKADFHRTFNKQFSLLPAFKKTLVRDTIELFLENPNHPSIRNHTLRKEWVGYRSITADEDLRIHFKELGKNRVLFVAVGNHNELYK